MIQPNELRLDNWVSGKSGQQFQLEDHHLISLIRNDIELYPISITPEVLEKCGFELRLDGDILMDYKLYPIYVKFQHDGGLLITILEYSSCSHIKHIHQLQNLYFALTGEELDYKP